jgi:meso-butanediol dehydrogenase/(S,S)-butanediol dehydrogenase/diacetyl reductase
MKLKERVAIVTGAAGGIGGGISRALCREGATVVLADLPGEALERTRAEIAASGASVEAAPVDVTDPRAVERLVEDTARRHGRLDQMWNNAGVIDVGPFMRLTPEEWRRVFSVNVEGVFYGTQAAARVMMEQPIDPELGIRGKIINTSSGASEQGRPILGAYGASKAAVNHLTKTASAVLADALVCCVILYPGNVYDGMWRYIDRQWNELEGLPEGEMARRRAAESPTGRFQEPDELGEICAWIAVREGMHLHGRIIQSSPAIRLA